MCNEASIQGIVQSLNATFAYFTLEDDIRVYMSVTTTDGAIPNLPPIGSRIVIDKCHRHGYSYVLCRNSIVREGTFTVECPENPFLDVIITHNMGCFDVIKMQQLITQVEKSFISLEVDLKTTLLISLLGTICTLMIARGNIIIGFQKCTNRVISRFNMTTLINCKFVEIKSNKYADFPYWSFGVHPSPKFTMLFGYLEVQPVYGFYMIKDSQYQIVVVIITEDCERTDVEISQLLNSYVLIENYTVITEIFNDGTPNIEYIITGADDIHVVLSHHVSREHKIFGIKPDNLHFENSCSFGVVKKSTVCVGRTNLPELLLQTFVRFRDKNVVWQEIFLILPSKFVSMNLHIKEGCLYVLNHNPLFKEITNYELTKIKHLKVYEVQGEDCFFESGNARVVETLDLMTVQECKFHIENIPSEALVSFRGIIKTKRFTNPLPSHTSKTCPVYGFGTPGTKVHQIVFYDHIPPDVIFLDVYLNSYENMLMPLGLIPQMEVIVRNVIPQSKKYLKSTIFTTFEVVSYNPSVSFNTVNLYKNDKEDWGVRAFFSLGHRMPVGILVWCRVYTIFMVQLTVTSRCAQCKRENEDPLLCDFCNVTQSEQTLLAKFHITDQKGQGAIVTESQEVVRRFMNVDPHRFENWKKSFENIRVYKYNYYDWSRCTPSYESASRHLNKINEKRIMLDMKSRKMYPSKAMGENRPFWYCIDARLVN